MKRHLTILIVLLGCAVQMVAQHFFNLTADEVKIDSILPFFSYQQPLGENYSDSVYDVCIVYPEFLDMDESDVKRYQSITSDVLPMLYIGMVNIRSWLASS